MRGSVQTESEPLDVSRPLTHSKPFTVEMTKGTE